MPWSRKRCARGLLDTRNRVLEDVVVYRGSLNSAQVRVGEIFNMHPPQMLRL